jgi:hypothetical protein
MVDFWTDPIGWVREEIAKFISSAISTIKLG